MAKRRVTLRAQWLGQMLRKLRDREGLTLKDAAAYLQKDVSSVNRFELGTYPVRRGDLYALLDLYGVDDRHQRDMLIQLTEEVWQTGWWEKYSDDNVWGSTIDLVWLESRAEEIRSFSALTVHGLLQTPDYARALMRATNPEVTPAQIERAVELRMERQKVLHREGDPLAFQIILDEAALRRSIGGAGVTADQLRTLLTSAERPAVDVRVIPFAAGAHASPEGTFALIKLEEPFPEVAYIESPGGAMYLETDDAEKLGHVYDRLHESTLSAEDSVAFIAALEKDLS